MFTPCSETNLIDKKITTHYDSPEIYSENSRSRSIREPFVLNLLTEQFTFSNSENEIDSSTIKESLRIENSFKSLYYVKSESEVINFIRSKDNFSKLLFELHAQIIKRFGDLTPELELINDCEIKDFITLLVTIPTQEEYYVASNKLKTLIKEWMFLQAQEFKRIVTISVF